MEKAKQHKSILIWLVLFLSLSFVMVSCASETNQDELPPPQPTTSTTGSPTPAPDANQPEFPLMDLCELDEDLEGQPIQVEGQITYLDLLDDGAYFDIQQADCQAGVWLESDVLQNLTAQGQELLVMDGWIAVAGTLEFREGEAFLDYIWLGEPAGDTGRVLDPTEKWWLKPQTYHAGEGPDIDLISQMNITVLHDWGSLSAGFGPNPDPYWSETAIRERWDRAHAEGMRVEAVVSLIDMWFVEFGPEDSIYSASGIDLSGNHIVYDDPVGFVGCTNLHAWQDFTRYKIFKAIDWGADGIIIDDYEGSSRWTSGVPNGMGGLENGPGGCFCSACEEGFRNYLKEVYSKSELEEFGISEIDSFDYSEYLLARGYTAEDLGEESRKFQGWDSEAEIVIPLYQDYADFQNLKIVEFLIDLREESIAYAQEEYGREISWSENAGELTYGAHKTYPYFDRNVGAIWQFGYPPKGTEGYQYRLGYSIYGLPRLRERNCHPVVVTVMNEYQTHNLWLLKAAEAYANLGALIEYDYMIIEGASDEVALASLTNDPIAKNRYNTFYLEHPEIFDFTALNSLANTAVLYSSASVHYDMNRHIQSFNGVSEILTDLNIQFDPLFIGDGLSYPDTLSGEDLARYQVVILPNMYALTAAQASELLNYLESGGAVIALGDFAVVDEFGETFNSPELETMLGAENFSQLRIEVFRADGVVDDYFNNIAAIYFEYYIENNHPAVEEILLAYDEEELRPRISEGTAQQIREQISEIIDTSLDFRFVDHISAENITAQAYQWDGSRSVIIHLLNNNYVLEEDAVLEQEDLELIVNLPAGFEASSVSLLSPDIDEQILLPITTTENQLNIRIPSLYLWDVILIE